MSAQENVESKVPESTSSVVLATSKNGENRDISVTSGQTGNGEGKTDSENTNDKEPGKTDSENTNGNEAGKINSENTNVNEAGKTGSENTNDNKAGTTNSENTNDKEAGKPNSENTNGNEAGKIDSENTKETDDEKQISENPTEKSNITTKTDASEIKNNFSQRHSISDAIFVEGPQTTDVVLDNTERTGSPVKNDENGEGSSPTKMSLSGTHDNGDDMEEYDPDLFITDEEKKAFEFMLDKRREDILQQKENFKTWVESITRRRMFALSRLRKINKCHHKRMEFYDKIGDYVKTADNVINSNETSPSPSSDKDSTRSCFENMVRENTGFVINQKDSPMNTSLSDDVKKDEKANSNTLNNNENSATNSYVTNADVVDNNISKNNDNTPKIVPVQS